MAKKSAMKLATGVSAKPWESNFSRWIKEIVKEIGHKCGSHEVYEFVRKRDGEDALKFVDGKRTNFGSAINVANKKHGFAEGRIRSINAAVSDDSEPTTADVAQTLDLLTSLGKSPKEVLALVTELKSVGSLLKLQKCLDSIVRVQNFVKPESKIQI